MKKKIVSMLLLVTMSIGLVACSGSGDSSSSSGDASAGDTSAGDTSAGDTSADADADADEPAEKVYPDLGGVEISIMDNALVMFATTVNPEADDYNPVNASYVEQIEELYNCKLVVSESNGMGVDDVIKAFNDGVVVADIVSIGGEKMVKYITNDLLYDFTGQTDTFIIPQVFFEQGTYGDGIYGYLKDDPSIEVIGYNREYFEQIGMEKTPTDMFMEGNWDYESFRAYLVEVQGKLQGDVKYAIGYDPFYWAFLAGMANGSCVMEQDLSLHLTDPAVVDAVVFYQGLIEDGLAAPLTVVTDGETVKVDSNNYYHHNNGTTAMFRMSQSDVVTVANKVFGITHMPWSEEYVSIGSTGEPDSYLTLSDNYGTGRSFYTYCGIMNNAPSGVDPVVLMEIMLTYNDLQGNGKFTRWYEEEQAGTYELKSNGVGTERNFHTEQDIEVWDWGISVSRNELAYMFNWAGIIDFHQTYMDIMADNLEARSALESAEAAAKAALDENFYN